MRELSTLETYVVSGGYDPNEVDGVVIVGRRENSYVGWILGGMQRFADAAELKATALLDAAQDKLEDAGDAMRRVAAHLEHLIISNSVSPQLNPNICDPSAPDDPDCKLPFARRAPRQP
jgi:hypothetical protein